MARAVIDHITQTLPGRDQNYVEPLLQDYVKALVAVLGHPANVEQLGALGGDGWLACADFCVDAVSRFSQGTGRDLGASLLGTPSRASPAPGMSLSLAHSTGRSGTASTQRSASHISGKILVSLMQGLLCLAGATNAPLAQRATEISSAAIQILQLRHLNIGSLQQAAFATLNCIISHTCGDDLVLVNGIARDLMPLVSHWWHPRTSASQSESVTSVRDEILRLLCGLQLHIDALTVSTPEDDALFGAVEDILEALWMEYSKRDDRSRLQISDLAFSAVAKDYFNTRTFGLRPFNTPAERTWAVVEVIAILESIYAQSSVPTQTADEDEQPRKRRRVDEPPDRLGDRLGSLDPGIKLTALQVIPFFLQRTEPSLKYISRTLDGLLGYISDKHSAICSWAMIACARYVSVSLIASATSC